MLRWGVENCFYFPLSTLICCGVFLVTDVLIVGRLGIKASFKCIVKLNGCVVLMSDSEVVRIILQFLSSFLRQLQGTLIVSAPVNKTSHLFERMNENWQLD